MSTKERPILFGGPMVKAILEGRKTQTRRVVKGQGDMEFDVADPHFGPYWLSYVADADGEDARVRCPYGKPGDRLWVRETWGLFNDLGFCDTSLAGLKQLPHPWQLAYRTDHVDPVNGDGPHQPCWRPSIFMPRWASRITLEITGIRVERLQQISEADARAEGISELPLQEGQPGAWRAADPTDPKLHGRSAVDAYAKLWQSIHGPGSWDANPWAWVVEFRRLP